MVPTKAAACTDLPGICYWYSSQETPCPYAPKESLRIDSKKEAREETDNRPQLKKTSDGWQVVIPIKKDLTWKDGHRIHPEDFVLGWHMIRKKRWFKTTRPYSMIRKVQAKKHSVVITYSRPYYQYLALNRLQPVPSSVSPQTSCEAGPQATIPEQKSEPVKTWALLVNQRHPHWKHARNRRELTSILAKNKLLAPYSDLFHLEPSREAFLPSKIETNKKTPGTNPSTENSTEKSFDKSTEESIALDVASIELTFKASSLSSKIADKIKEAIEEAGVRVLKKKVSKSSNLQATLQAMQHRGIVLAQIEFPLGHSLKHLLHSNFIPSQLNQYTGGNYSAFQDTKTDEILEVLDRSVSKKKRAKAEKRLQNRLKETAPFWILR